MLFVPATEPRKVRKALDSKADCVILDLEDAVALSEKKNARFAVRDILAGKGDRQVYVRINSIDTPFLYGDLTTIIAGSPTGVMLPKAETAEQVRCVDWLISQLEMESGLALGQIGLITLIETAGGVGRAPEIACSSSRITCMAFGAIDYTLDIGTKLSEDGHELFYGRSQVVVASRMGGCAKPIDTVYSDFRNADGLRRDSELALCLGYQGKMIIHPDQIDIVNETFSPSQEELAYARKVVAAFEEAEKNGVASVNLEGKMIDYPVVNRARQLLEMNK
jgi:citrate lyase subunit beta/citryl-CoA lyase